MIRPALSRIWSLFLCAFAPPREYCLILVPMLLLFVPAVASAADSMTYEGDWHTTNRKLDGSMTCIVTQLGNERWQGRFFGTWQGVSFDYTVPFTGPPTNLQGNANIDGADYHWTGQIVQATPGSFKGTFGGTRYNGYFDLKEKPATSVKPRTER